MATLWAGKAFAQVAARAIFLSVLSPTRNVVLYQLFGVPFDRGIKMHKMVRGGTKGGESE